MHEELKQILNHMKLIEEIKQIVLEKYTLDKDGYVRRDELNQYVCEKLGKTNSPAFTREFIHPALASLKVRRGYSERPVRCRCYRGII